MTKHNPLVLGAMLALTFSTGIADSVGYLGLDKVFTGNMTGNVIILGMALTGAQGLPVFGPLLALGGFICGAAIGGEIARRASRGTWTTSISVLFLLVGGVTLAVAAVVAAQTPRDGTPLSVTVAALIALAMGLQAAGARRIGIPDVTTVVVTSTLTALASETRANWRDAEVWVRRAGAVVVLAAGAVSGALLLNVGMVWPVLLASLLSFGAAFAGHTWAHGKPVALTR